MPYHFPLWNFRQTGGGFPQQVGIESMLVSHPAVIHIITVASGNRLLENVFDRYYSTFLNAIVALCPPKPSELLKHARTETSRAVFGM